MKENLVGVFSRVASTYDRVGPSFFAYFGRRLVELAEIPEGASVLDVAAGRGAALIPAAERVGPEGRVVGIDLSAEMVCETTTDIERLGLQNVQMMQMDAEALEFPDASFDVVLCGFALFFFPDLSGTLAEFCRVLRPGGRIAVTTWKAEGSHWSWLGKMIEEYLPALPQAEEQKAAISRMGQHDGLESVLKEAGLAPVRVASEAQDFVYPTEGGWWESLWSHGYRAALEQMDTETLERFKTDAFQRVQQFRQEDGIHARLCVLYGLGDKATQ